MSKTSQFRRLNAQRIIETVQQLQARIDARFPGSGLGQVVGELRQVAEETVTRTQWIQKPHFLLRVASIILSCLIIAVLVGVLLNIRQFNFDDFANSIQAVESSIGSVVFIGAAIIFLVSWETRIKRIRTLSAIHELRALAHIVDMHQLTKDPESYFGIDQQHTTTVKRPMTPFELNRYLDYCSETVALISKIAALYTQEFQDPVVLDAVDDIENLTAGFSRKIWQKITILEALGKSLAEKCATEKA